LKRTLSTTAALAFALVLGFGRPSAAQSTVTSADIQRLQDAIYDASRDVSQMRSSDSNLASQLQSDLDDARDEVTYLRVKLRRNEPISRSDYDDLRNRIDSIRARARGESSGRSGGYTPSSQEPPTNRDNTRSGDRDYPRDSSRPAGTVGRTSNPNEVPASTQFDVRLEKTLSSSTAQVEDRFDATTLVDLMNGDRVLVPAGSVMRGVVSSVQKAGHIERKGSLTLAFDQITIGGRSYPIRATVVQALESEGYKGDVGKIGAGAGVGAILGAILGGAKGALAGILVGAGGVIAATEGQDVTLPSGTVLRVKLDSDLLVK
jgi:hypothetical protein